MLKHLKKLIPLLIYTGVIYVFLIEALAKLSILQRVALAVFAVTLHIDAILKGAEREKNDRENF